MNTFTLIRIAAALGALTVPAAAQQYTVVDLVDRDATNQSWALDVNEAGQVVGSYMYENWRRTEGFVWQDGQIVERLIPRPSSNESPPRLPATAHHVEASAINDAGVVTGTGMYFTFGRAYSAYFSPLPPKGEHPELLRATALPESTALDITSTDPMLCSGVGFFLDPPDFPYIGFGARVTSEDGDIVTIGVGTAEHTGIANAANADHTMVGSVETNDGPAIAYRRDWESGIVLLLGTLGGPASEALDINNAGQIVGHAHTDVGRHHAFLYEDGQMLDLGTLGGPTSEAKAINEAGTIVGMSMTPQGRDHAFIYTDGQMLDLNDLVDPATPWILQSAEGINEDGWIVGRGWIDGAEHAFLLMPQGDCPADCNDDGELSVLDFLCFQAQWDGQTAFGDCNDDGSYDILDFICYQALFANGCG